MKTKFISMEELKPNKDIDKSYCFTKNHPSNDDCIDPESHRMCFHCKIGPNISSFSK